MARVHKSFVETYPEISMKELRNPIIFVVDMINGFVKEGALHDEAILEICDPLIDLLKENEHRVIFVNDSHPEKTREFLSYPTHCLSNTYESEIIDELKVYAYEEMRKNSTNTFVSPDFEEFLETRVYDHDDIIITGCCSDICIMQFALSLNAWLNEHNEEEKRVIIPIDCIETYHIDGVHDAVQCNEFSISNIAMNGIQVVRHIERED